MTPRRHFLGWEAPPLEQAAEWILEELGEDLDDSLIALPGARAGRRLLHILARRASPNWRPPRIVTQGQLVDELVELERPLAGRLLRTLAWERALRTIGTARRERIALEPAGGSGLRTRLRLAETVRTLHGELAPEGLTFERMTSGADRPDSAGEALRWEALLAAQRSWREVLDGLGVADPHEARLAAIEAGAVDRTRKVVLVGVADMTHLLRRLLETIGDRTTVLVVAPNELADGFDDCGALKTEFWSQRDVPIPIQRWYVAEKPVDQADCVVDVVAQLGDRFACDELTIGVADEEVVPYLERRLGEFGIRARNAAGTPIERTRPYQLLQAAARFVESNRYADFASLVRHPDLDAHLRDESDPVSEVDRYYAKHLPDEMDGTWLGPNQSPGATVAKVYDSLVALLGDLGASSGRPLAAVAPTLREFLGRVYCDVVLDPEVDEIRVLAAALGLMAEGIAELESIPVELDTEFTPSEAIELLLRQMRGGSIAPRGPEPNESSVELLGWLELPLDEASALVVTGFNEGRIPESVHGDAFLPDGVRRQLGLLDNDDRLARDVYTATLLVHSRAEVAFITGRRSFDGDPLVPSRLAFHAPESEIVERVRRFLPGADASANEARRAEGGARVRELPRREDPVLTEKMSVSSFKQYLDSPYLYYLRHVLGLKTLDDRAREMDPLSFGTLVHGVLEKFGASTVRNSKDPEPIAKFLIAQLRREVERRYGAKPLPAVRLQAEQLEYRLGIFAEAQAERAQEGWRIVHAEWEPAGGSVAMDVDGEPVMVSGKIDRIDHHPTRGWAILDYKTGEKGDKPEKTHGGKDGVWRDLQLPLYCHLAMELEIEELPQLGYFTLGRDEGTIGVRVAEKWDETTIEEALAAASEVVRAVRRGEFFDAGRGAPFDPILNDIVGVDLISGEEDE